MAFVDDDDYIMPQMYDLLWSSMAKEKADVVVCQWNYENTDGQHTIIHSSTDELLLGKHDSRSFSHYIYKGGYMNGLVVSPWNKLYKKKLLNNAEFGGYIGEEEEMNDCVFSKPCVVYVIPDELYYWCQNNDSASNESFSWKRWHYLEMLLKRIVLYSHDSFMVRETKILYLNIFVEYFYKAKNNNVSIPISLLRKFQSIYREILFNRNIRLRFLLRMTVFYISPAIYKALVLR